MPAQRGVPAACEPTDIQQIIRSPQGHQASPPDFQFGDGMLSSLLGASPRVGTSGWYPMPSPAGAFPPDKDPINSTKAIRYPVLRPLLPYIEAIMPISLACDLLELYFASSFSVHLHPVSPYILGHMFRKHAFLNQTEARQCSPGLLASMLWIAAQTSDSPFLTSPPSARGRICQRMLELTIGLLRPLIHGPSNGEISSDRGHNTEIEGVAIGGLGVAMTGGDQLTSEAGTDGVVDDIATYVHLATVVSASEFKAASLRWWNSAWSLARESKLGREIYPNAERPTDSQSASRNLLDPNSLPTELVSLSEERREERRRIWWLLYTVDRHLALCYNRPLFLVDAECDGLLQPLDDVLWQSGRLNGEKEWTWDDGYTGASRQKGPQYVCTGHSTWGYWLPLMTILGEIVDLNQARNHPRFASGFSSSGIWEHHVIEIENQLEAYARSLKEFEKRFADDDDDDDANNVDLETRRTVSRTKERVIHTKIVVAYGTHVSKSSTSWYFSS